MHFKGKLLVLALVAGVCWFGMQLSTQALHETNETKGKISRLEQELRAFRGKEKVVLEQEKLIRDLTQEVRVLSALHNATRQNLTAAQEDARAQCDAKITKADDAFRGKEKLIHDMITELTAKQDELDSSAPQKDLITLRALHNATQQSLTTAQEEVRMFERKLRMFEGKEKLIHDMITELTAKQDELESADACMWCPKEIAPGLVPTRILANQTNELAMVVKSSQDKIPAGHQSSNAASSIITCEVDGGLYDCANLTCTLQRRCATNPGLESCACAMPDEWQIWKNAYALGTQKAEALRNAFNCPVSGTPCPSNWHVLVNDIAGACLAPNDYSGPCGKFDPSIRYMPFGAKLGAAFLCESDRSWYSCSDPTCSQNRPCVGNPTLQACACPAGGHTVAMNYHDVKASEQFALMSLRSQSLVVLTAKASAEAAEASPRVSGASPPEDCECLPWVAAPSLPGYTATKPLKEGCVQLELDRPSVGVPFHPFNETLFLSKVNKLKADPTAYYDAGEIISPMGGCWCGASAKFPRPRFKACGCDGQIVYEGESSSFQHSGMRITPDRTAILRHDMIRIFKDITSLLHKHNIRYVVVSGGLIGYLRNQNFLPWDDDLDVRVHRDDWGKLKHIHADAKNLQHLEALNNLTASEQMDVNRGLIFHTASAVWDGRLGDIDHSPDVQAFIRTSSMLDNRLARELSVKLAAHVDVVRADHVHNPFWPYVQHMFSEPLRFVQMHGLNFSIPSDRMSDIQLTQQYGNNWMEPTGPHVKLVCKHSNGHDGYTPSVALAEFTSNTTYHPPEDIRTFVARVNARVRMERKREELDKIEEQDKKNVTKSVKDLGSLKYMQEYMQDLEKNKNKYATG